MTDKFDFGDGPVAAHNHVNGDGNAMISGKSRVFGGVENG